jgi:tRNA-2-methylthio-N6-dimethylallyladenosine synthase
VPGIALTTDVIVGFCGETETQYRRTLELLREVRFDGVFAAAFSPRPGTPAARLPDDVPRDEKRRRLNELLALQEGIGLERNRAWMGRRTEVLLDRAEPRRGHHDHDEATGEQTDPTGGSRLSGRNRENKLVHVDAPEALLGTRVEVLVERAGPYALVGRLAG